MNFLYNNLENENTISISISKYSLLSSSLFIVLSNKLNLFTHSSQTHSCYDLIYLKNNSRFIEGYDKTDSDFIYNKSFSKMNELLAKVYKCLKYRIIFNSDKKFELYFNVIIVF